MKQELETKIAHYQPAPNKLAVVRATPLLFLVGISGAGKDTIVHRLLARPEYYRTISHTTRAARGNHGIMERDGVDYHFIDQPTALRMLDAQEFVEVNYYSGNLYGTSIAEIAHAHEQGKIVLSDVDVHGADNFVRLAPEAKAVFILPPSFDEWQRRLSLRYGADKETHAMDIHRRMLTARDELRHVLATEHYYLMVNDELEHAVRQIDALAHDALSERRPAAAMAIAVDMLRQMSHLTT